MIKSVKTYTNQDQKLISKSKFNYESIISYKLKLYFTQKNNKSRNNNNGLTSAAGSYTKNIYLINFNNS